MCNGCCCCERDNYGYDPSPLESDIYDLTARLEAAERRIQELEAKIESEENIGEKEKSLNDGD